MGFSNDADRHRARRCTSQARRPTGIAARRARRRIDTTTFALTDIGPFNPIEQGAELTGTGAGELFAFYEIGPAG